MVKSSPDHQSEQSSAEQLHADAPFATPGDNSDRRESKFTEMVFESSDTEESDAIFTDDEESNEEGNDENDDVP